MYDTYLLRRDHPLVYVEQAVSHHTAVASSARSSSKDDTRQWTFPREYENSGLLYEYL